jgi:Skp family chaperone for outer membrane proteins
MNFSRIFLTLLMICGLSSQAFAQDIKMGFVDLSRLFDEYYKTKEYDEQLEMMHGKFEGERNDKISEIREAQARLGLLTEDQKDSLETDIEEMKAELLEYDRQQKQDLTKQRNERIQEILLEIEKVVSDYAEKQDYGIILNDRVLIYGAETYDLTDQVLTILNDN